jgi:hypothetical protein
VTLLYPADCDIEATLTSGKPDIATVPASFTIPTGSTSGSFTVSTLPVASPASVVIKASVNGKSKSATLKVQP